MRIHLYCTRVRSVHDMHHMKTTKSEKCKFLYAISCDEYSMTIFPQRKIEIGSLAIQKFLGSSSVFKSDQECSRVFKSVQECSSMFKRVQACSSVFKQTVSSTPKVQSRTRVLAQTWAHNQKLQKLQYSGAYTFVGRGGY